MDKKSNIYGSLSVLCARSDCGAGRVAEKLWEDKEPIMKLTVAKIFVTLAAVAMPLSANAAPSGHGGGGHGGGGWNHGGGGWNHGGWNHGWGRGWGPGYGGGYGGGGCDYSNAAYNNGWGWNPSTGTSCPPL